LNVDIFFSRLTRFVVLINFNSAQGKWNLTVTQTQGNIRCWHKKYQRDGDFTFKEYFNIE
jgi:hypothetical protein